MPGVFAPMTASLTDMSISTHYTTTDRAIARTAAALPARARWTGRSRVSSETDTVLAHISTSGLYRTRVSALRKQRGTAGALQTMRRVRNQRKNTCRPELELLLT